MAIKLHSVQTLAQKATRADVFYRSKNPNRVANPRWNFVPPYVFQGSTSGYTSGGAPPSLNTIDKFPFATDANATDVGDLTQVRYKAAGQSSTTNGYTSGGFQPVNTIDKFPFASNANATDVGDLTQARGYNAGSNSATDGYTSGGRLYSNPPTDAQNTIDKFPFASDANATDVGDLAQTCTGATGQSSTSNGYNSGGQSSAFLFSQNLVNRIEKFPFASNSNATNIGTLTQARGFAAGQSSTTSGYTSGGYGPPTVNTIDKFPFASDANATDVGDLSQGRYGPAGQSSTASGYSSGGSTFSASNVIDKFPFATNANATDVGDLSQTRMDSAGQQV